MFVGISNTPRDYAWGSTIAMAELLGSEPSGRPEAELWFGAHPGSPSRIVIPAQTGGAQDLAEWIALEPATALADLPRLPFLLKVLAGGPLSLQAHPTAKQAVEGFERENALGIPLDAPHRNYRDPHPKPEVIYALSETFDALCGFRPIEETRAVLLALGFDELIPRLASLADFFAWLMAGGQEVDDLVTRVVERAAGHAERAAKAGSGSGHGQAVDNAVADALSNVRLLARNFPGDTGIMSSLLLNRVTLTRGEALYLPAGNIHAYLNGVGIEVMTASDNVLRGGLTPKHVDVPELLRVLDVTPRPVPRLLPVVESPTLEVFRPDVDDFVLAHVTGGTDYLLTGPAIALCTSGSFELAGPRVRDARASASASVAVARGDAVYITPDESPLVISGSGELFLATTP